MTYRRDSTTGVMIFYRSFCRLLIFNLALANSIPSFSSIFQPSKIIGRTRSKEEGEWVEKVTGTHSTTEASKDIHLGQSVVYIITSTILSYCSMISTATVYYSCRQRKYCNGYINNKELQSYNECQISSILSNNESSSHFKSKRGTTRDIRVVGRIIIYEPI